MFVAMLLLLALPEKTSSDCAATASRGPDFMALISGGTGGPATGTKDRIDGTIVDPPARGVPLVTGTLSSDALSMSPSAEHARPPVSSDPAITPDRLVTQDAAGVCSASGHAG